MSLALASSATETQEPWEARQELTLCVLLCMQLSLCVLLCMQLIKQQQQQQTLVLFTENHDLPTSSSSVYNVHHQHLLQGARVHGGEGSQVERCALLEICDVQVPCRGA